MKRRVVYLDMDGTIYNLYGIDGWLRGLRSEESGVFSHDERLITEEDLFRYFPPNRYEIRVLSMTPKGASKKYCAQVIAEKDAWLDHYFPSLTKRIYRAYGNNKNLAHSEDKILVDDSEAIRSTFRGTAIAPPWLEV